MTWISLFVKVMEAITLYLSWRYDPKNQERQEALRLKLKREELRRELDEAIASNTLAFNSWLVLILRELRPQKDPNNNQGRRRDILGVRLPGERKEGSDSPRTPQ
jgi:hypothetical protein